MRGLPMTLILAAGATTAVSLWLPQPWGLALTCVAAATAGFGVGSLILQTRRRDHDMLEELTEAEQLFVVEYLKNDKDKT